MTQLQKPPHELDTLSQLRRDRARQHARKEALIFYGPRNDAPYSGEDGPRVQVGRLSDDTYGIETWDVDGVRTTVTWV